MVVFVLAALMLMPLELLAIVAGVCFGALRGGIVALIGSLAAAVIGYVAGRAIGAEGLRRWISRRSYRSVRQLGARGVGGVVMLRLASVASAGSIHLVCGAGRIPFATYIAGTRDRPRPGDRCAQRIGRPASAHASESVGVERIDHDRRIRAPVRACIGTANVSSDSSICAGNLQPTRPGGVRLVAAPAPLRVATYNVHACVGRDGRHDPDRVATVIGELNADVVALQEFTYPASVALETRTPVVLTTLDRYECALGPTRQRTRQTVTECFGNALLTRHPIVEVHRIDLSMERREARGALAATIDVGGALLHVLATHLGLRIHERRFQVRQILDYLDSVRNTSVVVLGDFNDWLPGRSAAHVLDRRLGRPPRPATFPVFWPVVALDRIWVQPRSCASTGLCPRYSDRSSSRRITFRSWQRSMHSEPPCPRGTCLKNDDSSSFLKAM